jgi:hypothetical protein
MLTHGLKQVRRLNESLKLKGKKKRQTITIPWEKIITTCKNSRKQLITWKIS